MNLQRQLSNIAQYTGIWGLSLIILTFVVFSVFLVHFIHQGANRISNFQTEINLYKASGWNVESVQSDFENYPGPLLLINSTFYQPSDKDAAIYKFNQDLQTTFEAELTEITNEFTQLQEQISQLSIEGLDQDLSSIEELERSILTQIANHQASGLKTQMSALQAAYNNQLSVREKLASEQIGEITVLITNFETICGIYHCYLSYQADHPEDIISEFQYLYSKYNSYKNQYTEYLELRGSKFSKQRILVSDSQQMLYMLEDEVIIDSFPAATGVYGHATAQGEFQVYEKLGTVWGYYSIWMPYWMTIYYSGSLKNGIHGVPWSPDGTRWTHWEKYIGQMPLTYGCVMPNDVDVSRLYEWAEVGTPVSIVW